MRRLPKECRYEMNRWSHAANLSRHAAICDPVPVRHAAPKREVTHWIVAIAPDGKPDPVRSPTFRSASYRYKVSDASIRRSIQSGKVCQGCGFRFCMEAA